MAIVQNPITGRTKGKFSTAVFSKQFGKNTMRSKALTVRNPNTTAQKEQRSMFSTALEFARTVLGAVRIGYAKFAVGMSPYNAFMSHLIKDCIDGAFPDFEIDYTAVKVAQGSLEGIVGVSATAVANNKIRIDWQDNTGQGNSSDTDELCICIVNNITGDVTQYQTNASRETETFTTTDACGVAGNDVVVYAFFVSMINGTTCDSVYLGKKTLILA